MGATSSAGNKESALRVRSIFVLHLIDKALYFFLPPFSQSSKRKTLGARNNKCAQSGPANARLALVGEAGTKNAAADVQASRTLENHAYFCSAARAPLHCTQPS